MTIPELKKQARMAFDFAVQRMRENNGDLNQMFHLVKRDGSVEVLLIDGAISNSEQEKIKLSRLIKARVATGEIVAVIMMSDTFVATISQENEMIRRKLRMNVDEASAFGLCEKQEAVVVMLESPIYQQMLQQIYRRDPKDGRKITLVGELKITDNSDPNMKMAPARFTGYFAESKRA